MERVRLNTKDGKEISGLYFQADNPKGWVIYLHMMPAAKESWLDLAEKLALKGYCGIAIDLRGHGESEGGPYGYGEFSDAEHQASINDVEAADIFLKNKGVKSGKGIVIGASIGANLALQHISSHPEYKIGIFLSPGMNYHDVNTIPAAQRISPEDKLLFVSSEDDIEKNGRKNENQVVNIIHALPSRVYRREIVYKSAGHGTNIFSTKEKPNPLNEIISFTEG